MLNIVLAVLLAAQAAPAAQRNDTRTWYQAYADAQQAIQSSNWQKAIADIDAASRLGAPRPGRNILFYGDVYRDYLPDYYLGIAYMNLARFSEADSAFERVKQAQLIAARDTLYTEFTRQAGMAKDALQKLAAQNQQVQGPPANVAQTVPDVAQQPASASLAVPAAQGGGAPGATAPVYPGASNPGAQASAGPAPGTAAPTLTPEQQKLAASQPSRPATAAVRPAPTVQARATPAARAPDAKIATSRGPQDERGGILQFFQGDYEAAGVSLASLAARPGASPRSHFYLACSMTALVLTGKAPRSSIDEARAQMGLAGDTGQFAADRRLISPRILQELGAQP